MNMDDRKDGFKTGSQDVEIYSRPVTYRLYRRRFVGLAALVCCLKHCGGFSCVWFGAIATETADEFGFTLGQVNWLSSVLNLTYLPASIAAAFVCQRWGVRMTCYVGSAFLIISAWVSDGPFYSETWFDLKGRTTTTMIIAVANPLVGIVADISPIPDTARDSILVLAIISRLWPRRAFDGMRRLLPLVSPRASFYTCTHADTLSSFGNQEKPSFMSLMRAICGREPSTRRTYMSLRERMDFAIVTLIFGVFAGVVNSFSILTSQYFEPYGYSNDTAGLFGATLFLVGLVMAGITSPLFDRVLTHHLALTCKVACPILGVLWLCMIWIVKPNNTGALFVMMALIGGLSLPVLPAALELAVEVTRNADGSSAILWSAGNLMTVIFVLSENALRAGPSADPPLNMHQAIIFAGIIALAASVTAFGSEGKQTRRKLDEQRMQEAKEDVEMIEHVTP
ncbi:major facilitator superfamily domain-containing protein [Irpex lacteus]|nr:major facilitator superfamily domain-containing protein [Irpex lacteus]